MTVGRLTERQWQGQVLEVAGLNGWWCYHTYDSRRSQPGFPDLVMVRERVVYAELKREGGRLSPAQRDVIDRLENAGQEVYVWWPGDYAEVQRVLSRRRMGAE